MFLFLFFISCIFNKNISQSEIYDVKNSYIYIVSGDGFGSGNIINYKNNSYLITANHCIDYSSDVFVFNKVSLKENMVYASESTDIAVFKSSNKFKSIKYKESRGVKYGDEVHYWCMPSGSEEKYFVSKISRIGEDEIILNGFGWFGCSGSVVFDSSNAVVGVITGIFHTEDTDSGVSHSSIIYVSKFKKDFFGE